MNPPIREYAHLAVLQCGARDVHHLHKPDEPPAYDIDPAEIDITPASLTALVEADTKPANHRSVHHQRTSKGQVQATTSLYPAQPVADGWNTAAGELYRLVFGQSNPCVTQRQMAYRMNRTSVPRSPYHHPRHRHTDIHRIV
jgi:hypothetical protein